MGAIALTYSLGVDGSWQLDLARRIGLSCSCAMWAICARSVLLPYSRLLVYCNIPSFKQYL